FKTILRFYHEKADKKPNAFVKGLSITLIQVAQYHTDASEEKILELKALASKLPSVPFDLTEKNKKFLMQCDSQSMRTKLLFLPEQLLNSIAEDLENTRSKFVNAQVAIAIDVLLVAPVRSQNLIQLNWRQHFSEPNGPKENLILRIPAEETKTKKQDLVFEIPPDVARRLRWYKNQVLPRLNADPDGDLFVTARGKRKTQSTFSSQIVRRIGDHVGISMSPHKFRHFAAYIHLEAHPEDFETVRALLGHSYSKTTLIYAGSSSRRASRAYGGIVTAQLEALKLQRPKKPRRKRRANG
ncbi:MAG: tyrosine-type recombinase/integrase, partial [Desulfobulbia bacterium]